MHETYSFLSILMLLPPKNPDPSKARLFFRIPIQVYWRVQWLANFQALISGKKKSSEDSGHQWMLAPTNGLSKEKNMASTTCRRFEMFVQCSLETSSLPQFQMILTKGSFALTWRELVENPTGKNFCRWGIFRPLRFSPLRKRKRQQRAHKKSDDSSGLLFGTSKCSVFVLSEGQLKHLGSRDREKYQFPTLWTYGCFQK